MQPNERIVVYHDRSCPICRAEMEELKKIDGGDVLTLVDCSSTDFADADAAEAGLDQRMLMSAMYIRVGSDHWLQGPDAFEYIYDQLGMPKMAAFWGSKRLRPLINVGYRLFARTRGFLALFGVGHIVRWYVRREAQKAAQRATHCERDSDA
ncbi:MAG: DUF393 domain-containing protein [Pseudomonadota bacterium]